MNNIQNISFYHSQANYSKSSADKNVLDKNDVEEDK